MNVQVNKTCCTREYKKTLYKISSFSCLQIVMAIPKL